MIDLQAESFRLHSMKNQAAARNKSNEVFIEHKKKKRWIDEKSGYVCFMLFARSLYIDSGGLKYWSWTCFKEAGDDNIEVAKLSHMCNLVVQGKLKISDLSLGIIYEAVYVVKLTNGASGWEHPLTLRLSLPGGRVQDRKISLQEKPRGEWIELKVGNFFTKTEETGDVYFDLRHQSGQWKTGLIIKGVILRPKDNLTPSEIQSIKKRSLLSDDPREAEAY